MAESTIDRSKHAGGVARVLFVVLVLTGCGASQPAETEPSVDFSSVPTIHIEKHAFAKVPLQQATPNLVIGSETAKGTRFGSIHGIDVSETGAIYVFDAIQHRITQFSDSGTAARAFAREGDGPGEIRSPHAFQLYTTSGIAVMHDRVHVLGKFLYTFDTAGTYLGRSPDRVSNTWAWNGLAATDSGLIVEQEYFKHPGQRDFSQGFSFSLYDAGKAQIRATTEITYPSRDYGGSIAGTQLLSADPAWAISKDGLIYYVVGDSFDVVVKTLRGTIVRRYISPVDRIKTNSTDVSEGISQLEQQSEVVFRQPASREIRRRMRSGPHAEFRPAIGEIIVSREKDLLLQRLDVSDHPYAPRRPGKSYEWDVISEEGRVEGRYLFPDGFIPKVFRECTVYGLQFGENDKSMLVRYHIAYAEEYCRKGSLNSSAGTGKPG